MKQTAKMLISTLLLVAILMANFALISVSAATAGIVSAYSSSPITVDGEIGENEVWASAENISLDAWKSKPASETQTDATYDAVSTLKIANTENYLYLYLEADHFTNTNISTGARAFVQMPSPRTRPFRAV